MKFLARCAFFSLLVVSMVSLVAPSFVLADTSTSVQPFGNRDMDSPISLEDAYILPGVHAVDLSLENNNGRVTGSFTVLNNEQVVIGGLQYTIEVFGFDGNLYQIYSVRDQFALLGKEKKTISFSYDLGVLPAGDYTFRIQLATNTGRLLGWVDKPLAVNNGATSFVVLTPNSLNVAEFGSQNFETTSGPNVSPSGNIPLKATLENTTWIPLTVTPVVDLYDFNIAKGEGTSVALAPITLAAGQTKQFTFPVTATAKAGVYSAFLKLVDNKGKTVSSLGEYRWVVKGASADIMPLQINHLAVSRGDQTIVKLDFVGAADAQTPVKANVEVAMRDSQGVVATASLEGINLTDAIAQSTATLKLKRDVVGTPSINVVIKDAASGAILVNHVTTISLLPEQLQTFATIKESDTFPYVLVVLAGALLLGMGIWLFRKNTMTGLSKIALPGLGLFILSVGLLVALQASAFTGNGIEVWTPALAGPIWHNLNPSGPVVSLFINSPIHDASIGTYSKNAVPLSYRVTYGVCDNKVSVARVVARFDINGNKQTNLEGTSANWSTVHDATYSYGPACPNGATVCYATNDFASTLDLSSLGNKCSTTLQLAAKLGQIGTCNPPVPNGNISSTDPNFAWIVGTSPSNSSCTTGTFTGQTFHFAQAINVWLNFNCGVCATNADCGTNSLVGNGYCQYGNVYKDFKTFTCNNPGTANATCTNSTTPQLQTTCNTSQTCSGGTCQNVACNTNADCGTNGLIGSPMCQGNAIYQSYKTYTCNNPGTSTATCSSSTTSQLQTTCSANQICSGNTCQNVTCNTNADCGTNGLIGSPTCQGNAIYQNYKTYTCSNPGTVNATCSNSTASQLQTTCATNQTCSGGTCNTVNNLNVSCSSSPSSASTNQSVTFTANASGGSGTYTYNWSGSCVGYSQNCYNTFNQPNTYTAFLTVTSGGQSQSTSCLVNVSQSCTSNASQRCVGNNVYWFDSCGNQQGLSQQCASNQTCQNNTCQNTCTSNASQRCVGNSLYWYDSCGTQQGLAQQCASNQTCQNNACVTQQQQGVSIVKSVRNLSSGSSSFTNGVNANPGDIAQFKIEVSSTTSQYINNVTVKDVLPTGLVSQNGLTLDGVANSQDIVSGISVGSISSGQTRTILYQAKVSSTQITTLRNQVTATTDSGITATASAFVVVNLGGASTVPTGLTNGFFADSFFLPLLIIIGLIWLFRSRIVGIRRWLAAGKSKSSDYI